MHVDAMTAPQPLGRMGRHRPAYAGVGLPALLFTETGRIHHAAASGRAGCRRLASGPAFPRSPFVSAAIAWELQQATGGKFRLGLGTQVRTHVVRRYGMAFERPGPRLRDYVRAVKAVSLRSEAGRLDHHGEFYDLDFITPQWSPGPIDAPDPKVESPRSIRGCCGWQAKWPTECMSIRWVNRAT